MPSSSEADSAVSNSRPARIAPSSPLAVDVASLEDPFAVGELPQEHMTAAREEAQRQRLLMEEEEKARIANQEAEKKRREALRAAKKRRKQNKHLSPAERLRMASELEEVLMKCTAFANMLLKNSQALGRVGTRLDGKALGEHDLEIAKQPKCISGGTMRDYQLEGVTWMSELCEQGLSGILADEMGLGKTVQTIGLIGLLRERDRYYGPYLVVAPLSTLSNWMDEFHHWAPTIPAVMYHGTREERDNIAKTRIFNMLHDDGRPSNRFPVVCTSYEMVLRDSELLKKVNWEFIIIDEGHRMKNFDSKLFRDLQMFKSATRLLITGTPLQNNVRELWSLLHFLMPSVFTNFQAFESWFDFSDELYDDDMAEEFIDDQENQELMRKLHVVLQPLLLRRVKADVASHLPKKREYILFAPMTREQTDLYKAITDANVDTRAFLENKVVERIMQARDSPASSAKASPRESRASSVSPKAEPKPNGKQLELPVRSSPRKKNGESPDAPPPVSKDAFALMMGPKRGRGRPRKEVAVPAKQVTAPAESEVATPPKSTRKRKNGTTAEVETPAPKSAKSSRESTPGSVPRRSSGRVRKTRAAISYYEPADDDLLNDKAFEARLAQELAQQEEAQEAQEAEVAATAEELERVKTLELAKREIGSKKLGNPVMQLRQVCNSPHIFYNPWDSTGLPVDESIVTSSGKMLLLDRLLPALFKDDHKVLIFSQFKTQLDILEDYCRQLRHWPVCRIDGSVAQDDRRMQIKLFNSNKKIRIFLLSTRAGGQGINLASADTVILFDSDWNPQQDLQAQDRAHRIGQTRPVIVYRFATKGTVEETLLMSADAKRRLEKLVIKKGNLKTLAQRLGEEQQIDPESLKALLLRDGERYKFSGEKEILSEADLAVLCDRSDAAYERAAAGHGNASNFTVIETGADGITEVGRGPAAAGDDAAITAVDVADAGLAV